MATIHRCDGCDREFRSVVGNLSHVEIQWNTNRTGEGRDSYDFCGTCLAYLKRHIRSVVTEREVAAE